MFNSLILTFLLISVGLFMMSCSSGVIEQESENSEYYIMEGDNYFSLNEYDKALSSYQKAKELDNTNAETYYKIGLVYGSLHSQEGSESSIIRGRKNRLDRVERLPESNYNQAVYYFRKAYELGHLGAREILRTMHENIQHRDVQH